MTNEQILKKAIEKAVCGTIVPEWMIQDGLGCDEDCNISVPDKWLKNPSIIIFSHDFAKAFWGEKEVGFATWGGAWEYTEDLDLLMHAKAAHLSKRWQYHLQQMVLKEEPLKYIEKFL